MTMRIITTIAVSVFVLAACGKSDQTTSNVAAETPQPTAASAPVPTTVTPAVAPVRDHNYAMVEDGEYGYQPAISEEEANNGVATTALAMVRYQGQKNGVYVLEMHDESGSIFRMECKDPCEYVKTRVIFQGQTIKSETVPNAPNSLMHAVFEDAMGGKLTPYKKQRN